MSVVETVGDEHTVPEASGGASGQAPGPQEVRQSILDLGTSVYSFAALSCAFELGMLDELSSPQTPAEIGSRTGAAEALVRAVLDILAAVGIVRAVGERFACTPGGAAFASGKAKEFLKGDLRSTFLQSADLIERSRSGSIALETFEGWAYTDPELLEAQGARSAEGVAALAARLIPLLDGLAGRLRGPGASLLDVGTGVGRLAIEMCSHFSNLRVVGIDPYETPLNLARRNVAGAGLEGRIELRSERVEDLNDERRFDLAWVPVMFLTPDVAARGLQRVHTALRPGGWALVGSLAQDGDGLQPAVLRLLALLHGSGRLVPEQAAAMLRAAAYENVTVLPPFPGVAVRLIVGQRPTG